jgi:hypothetical protein
MSEQWHDIDDPGGFSRPEPKSSKLQPILECDVGQAAQPQKKEAEIRLLKGTWLGGEKGFEFKEQCNARIEAEFLKDTKNCRIKVETFVRYGQDEEDLHQSKEVFLDDDGIGEFKLTLFYGNRYSEAQSQDNADPTCQYVFKATADNCTGELESELLTMPFVPDCLNQQQEKKAQANKDGAQNAGACSGDCDQCEKKSECFPSADECELKETCKIQDSCARQQEETPSGEEQQESIAQTNTDAAQSGAACTQDCATCENKDECGK